jgi:protocatechuate 3,4-dioxygenase beta subunit
MRLLAQTFTFRYSWYRKDFVYSGTLMMNEDGSVTLINVPRRSAPISHVAPLAIYDQRTSHLHFTVRGIRYLRDFNINLPTEVRLDDILFEKT